MAPTTEPRGWATDRRHLLQSVPSRFRFRHDCRILRAASVGNVTRPVVLVMRQHVSDSSTVSALRLKRSCPGNSACAPVSTPGAPARGEHELQ